MFNHISIAIRSARLVLALPIFINVWILTFLLLHSWRDGFLLGTALSCISAFGFLINDLWDLRADRENKSGRLESAPPIVLVIAATLAASFLIAGLSGGILLGTRGFTGLLAISIGLIAYTYWIRPKLILANLLAAVLASSPVWLPNVVFNQPPNLAQSVLISVAAIMLFGREIVFDVVDEAGDAKVKRRTLPILLGKKVAIRFAAIWQLSGCALLTLFSVIMLRDLPFDMGLLLCVTLIIFVILLVPINFTVFQENENCRLIQRFILRTRLAMCLLPVIMFVFLSR